MGEQKAELIEFDIRGQICPSTLLTTLREVNSHRSALKKGRVQLSIMTDNRDSTATIPDSVRNMGYAVTVQKLQDYYRILIEKPISAG
ncbi:MAG: sulfurtransferase TusA family protein [Desulfuromonas sp.]|jgi:TusA-related sulfurtransferase|nr:MAG: sulfurtransferase TusA family protein [Desulfuromonas sp.]